MGLNLRGSGKTALWALVALVLGVALGSSLVPRVASTTNPINADCAQKYPLTNQDLDCDEFDASATKLDALDAAFDKATARYIDEGKASRVSVWVRDLTSKQHAESGETEQYSPASLLKLPLAIAYYKFSELQPSLLEQSIIYQKPAALDDSQNFFTKPSSLVVGKEYTVEQLIDTMMSNSDNGASLSLFERVEPSFYNKTLVDIGIQIPQEKNPLDYVTAKTYANIFRILYNASYLDRNLSQKTLNAMTESTFKGLAEPIPSSVVVAHKFGERTVIGPDGQMGKKELHDCGLVYKSPHPYTICIMTEGSDFNSLLSIIKDLSKLTYENI